jgi:hypothetical protein
MDKEPEIVFRTTVGKLVVQITKSGNRYVHQITFSTGLVFEQDYTEEDYQDFSQRMRAFNVRSTHSERAEKSISP